MAPSTGDIREELVKEAAEFLGLSTRDVWQRLSGAHERFVEEWQRAITDPADASRVASFYNESDAELFELIGWHASDPIHLRTLMVRDMALAGTGRSYLDYGAGIGSDAVAFSDAGFDVTLADVSERLLAFAAFRCRKRGVRARTIDLKRESLPPDTFDVAVCFDVLEHIPDPLETVRSIHRSLRNRALFAVHAPFGDDPDHPMHVVHEDVVTPRLRSLGLEPIDCRFPVEVRAPRIYRKAHVPRLERLGYFVYDGYLDNPYGRRLASWYRALFPRATVAEYRA